MNKLATYFTPKMLIIFALGLTSGLPLPLVFGTLSYWLATLGVDKTTIGLFAALTAPYNLKFMWSPLMEKLSIPYLTAKIGHRKSWLIVCQGLVIGAMLFLGGTNPTDTLFLTALGAFLLSVASASYDIVVDAYRVELLEEKEYGEGSAMGVNGYRIGMLVSGAGALFLSDYIGWFAVFAIMAGVMLIGTVAVLFAPSLYKEKITADKADKKQGGMRKIGLTIGAIVIAGGLYKLDITSGFISYLIILITMCVLWFPKTPIAGLSKTDWIMIILLVSLYKFSDAFAGTMMTPFYVDLGFSGKEIASVSKIFGLIATLIGAFLGGYTVSKIGMYRGLFWGAILQMLSNLVFIEQARQGHSVEFLTLTIAIENLSGGFGTAAFVAFITGLCHNSKFVATEYALLTSISGLGRTILSSSSGGIIDYYALSWEQFFLMTTLTGVPVLIILRCMKGSIVRDK